MNNCRPVSILPNISNLYERCMDQQMNKYFESLLSKFQCGFRQGFSACDGQKKKNLEATNGFLLRFLLTSPKLLTAYFTIF